MSASCVFCQILSDPTLAYRVGENARATAFFDAYPLVRGHTLIVPKRHVTLLADLTDEEIHGVFGLMQTVMRRMYQALDMAAATVGVNDGTASGQAIPHVHVHIIPRAAGDSVGSIHSLPWPRPRLSRPELHELAARISAGPLT